MNDLISRSALIEEIRFVKSLVAIENTWLNGYATGLSAAIDAVVDAPAVDAVPVVRCKDCDVPHNKWTGCPYMNGLIPPTDHFCSYGERRADTCD